MKRLVFERLNRYMFIGGCYRDIYVWSLGERLGLRMIFGSFLQEREDKEVIGVDEMGN